MAPAGEFIQVMSSQDLVLGSKFEELQGLLRRLALEDVEVLDNELVLLGPSYSQPLLIFVEGRLRLSESSEPTDAARVQKIEYFLVVDLQKRGKYTDMLGSLFLSIPLDLFKQLHNASLRYACFLHDVGLRNPSGV